MTAPADDLTTRLRDQITTGELAPGDTLPTVRQAQALWGVGETIVRTTYARLATEGLVRGVRRKGTVVIGPGVQQLPRRRTVFHDDRGYYFDRDAQGWQLVGKPTIRTEPASADIAHRLHIDATSPVVVRDRVMGLPGTRRGTKRTRPQPLQIATTYLPGWLVECLPIVGEPDTKNGGIYARIEEWAQQPLTFEDAQGAVNATTLDAKRLRVPAGAALVRLILRVLLPDGRPVAVTDYRLDAAKFETVQELVRDAAAAWPPVVATAVSQVPDDD